MPRIITPASEHSVTCPRCTAVIGYAIAEVRHPGHFGDDPDPHILCPSCNGKIVVGKRRSVSGSKEA